MSTKAIQNLYNSFICRLCSEENINGRYLYQKNDKEIDASVLINSYLPIKITNDEIFPRWICPGCYIQVESTAQFFEMVIKGQERLRDMIGAEPPEEILEIEGSENETSHDIVVENILFPRDHAICLRVNGNKPKKKRGRPPKPSPKVLEQIARRQEIEQQAEAKPKEIEEDENSQDASRKRKRKTPIRYEGIVEGKELEKVYHDEGVFEDLFEKEGENDEGRVIIGHIQMKNKADVAGYLVNDDSITTNRKTKIICDICEREFIQEYRYLLHRKSHSVRFECRVCQQQFFERLNLSEHQAQTQHQGEGIVASLVVAPENKKPEVPSVAEGIKASDQVNQKKSYSCESCDRTFSSLSSIIYHEETTHNEGRLFVCQICNKSFKHKQLLRRHQVVHAIDRPFSCETCGSSFKTKAILANHQSSHEGEKKFECPFCQSKFTYKNSLNTHLKCHDNTRPSFECEYCHKSFSQRGNLKEHLRIHTNSKPFICNICSKPFTTSSQHNLHMKRHANFRPYKCEVEKCQKTFLLFDNYKTHMRRHAGIKPYSCSQCSQAFTEKWALTKHIRSHTGYRPYSCSICEKQFSDHSNYSKHVKSHSAPNAKITKNVPETQQEPKMWQVVGSLDEAQAHQLIYVTYNPNLDAKNSEEGNGNALEAVPALLSFKIDGNDESLNFNPEPEVRNEVLLGLETNHNGQVVDTEDNSAVELITNDGQKIRLLSNINEPLDLINEFLTIS